MNGNTENSGNDFFYELLDNPADLSHSNAFNLQLLINDYPQSGLLRSMLAVKLEEERVRTASAYVDPKLLYKIANDFSSLPKVADEQIAFCETPENGKAVLNTINAVDIPNFTLDESNYFHVPIDNDLVYLEEDEAEEVVVDDEAEHTEGGEEEQIEAVEDDKVEGEVSEQEADEQSEIEESENSEAKEENSLEELDVETDVVAEVETAIEEEPEELNETAPTTENEEYVNVAQAFTVEDEYATPIDEVAYALSDIGDKPVHPHQEIDDDIFEEIVSIEDIGIEQLAIMDKANEEHEEAETDATPEEEVKLENSYKVFEPTLPEDEERKVITGVAAQLGTGKKAGERLARYNDEKMPYSFMWWLDKTRKEHAAIYQPFVEGKIQSAPDAARAEAPGLSADHLQQQYLENIFTVSGVVSELNLAPAKVDAPAQPADKKADKIIERFIQEEPQIKHPAKAKLDNENKAKKSSEDRDELVTETLARIYTEQMLYHKAILTYKKLMLKFPEKSLYFASQIEQLEKKIN